MYLIPTLVFNNGNHRLSFLKLIYKRKRRNKTGAGAAKHVDRLDARLLKA